MTDQPATGPRTLTVHWHPDAVHDAIAGAQAAIQTTDPDQPVQLSWQEAACLLDMARAWINAQEDQQPAELVEVPGISPAEFEAFKTRWIELHTKDAFGGVTVEEATQYWEANKHLVQLGAIDWQTLKGHIEAEQAGYAPGVEQRITDLPDASVTLADDADGRSP